MPIYHHLKTIFVRVPKTASTSICERLYSYDCYARYFGATNKGAIPTAARFKHESLQQIKEAILPETFEGYYKVGFVRNPWDWLVSYYHYYQILNIERGGLMIEGDIKYGNEIDDNLRKQINAIKKMSFSNFLSHTEEALEGNPSSQLECAQIPQHIYFIDSDGKMKADFIGKYENLDKDWGTLCKKIGTEPFPVLTRKNTSEHENYREYYRDIDIERVAKMYNKDIKMFSYSF